MKGRSAEPAGHVLWSSRLTGMRSVPRPGPVYGDYPVSQAITLPDQAWRAWLMAWWRAPSLPSRRAQRRFVTQVRDAADHWAQMTEAQQAQALPALRAQLGSVGLNDELTAKAFGLVCAQVQLEMGFRLHDVQILAAWWMLGQRLVEMATGEGKTLTVLLAAATAALSGIPVHVMTANDYLARRDAEQVQPFLSRWGLRVTCVQGHQSAQERKQAYQSEVVYVTAKEVAFDHLRDRAARAMGNTSGIVLRGLCMAILDEADGILLDEACMPLVLARQSAQATAAQRYRLALFLAKQLTRPQHFDLVGGSEVRLSAEGQQRLDELASDLTGEWQWRRFRQEQVSLALCALHTFQRDVHYLVRDDAVHIIDETTGRLAEGRAWSRGLHQMIALKEGLQPEPESGTESQTTYQTFFPRYVRLAGLSGTLWEDRHELLLQYGLPVVQVPLRQPSRREVRPTVVLRNSADKWQWVARQALHEAGLGRAVLIGTSTVADADAVSDALRSVGQAHQVLTARQDEAFGAHETHVVARAGGGGQVTVATQMAGRGTDVHLSADVLARGGLHVINTHLNRSGRIDRQLIGRSARQGAPGSCQTVLSWADETLSRPPSGLLWCAWQLARRGCLPSPWVPWVVARCQRQSQRQMWHLRWQMSRSQAHVARQLALAGREDWA